MEGNYLNYVLKGFCALNLSENLSDRDFKYFELKKIDYLSFFLEDKFIVILKKVFESDF